LSFQSLKEKLIGDELLNTHDFIDEIKSVGAEVDVDSYVTVYGDCLELIKEMKLFKIIQYYLSL
jgi:hypothetical protein